ncbi:hypothetical protein [Pseudogemmobacter hezensis]|nr:hypothetical protein [Pseudogemmobacter hezensis]
MGRIFKTVLLLAILGFAALAGYAYLVDMTPEPTEVTRPVTLDAN